MARCLVEGGDWFQIRNRLCRDYQIIESSENNEGGISIGSSLHVEVSQELQAKKYKQGKRQLEERLKLLRPPVTPNDLFADRKSRLWS
jgi:hypothetical protein